jgi:hypothetical protein
MKRDDVAKQPMKKGNVKPARRLPNVLPAPNGSRIGRVLLARMRQARDGTIAMAERFACWI